MVCVNECRSRGLRFGWKAVAFFLQDFFNNSYKEAVFPAVPQRARKAVSLGCRGRGLIIKILNEF